MMRPIAAVTSAWRRSLQFRTVASTVLVTVLVVGVAEFVLVQRISTGLMESEQRSALTEVASGRSIARASGGPDLPELVREAVLGDLISELEERAGRPAAYVVALRVRSDPDAVSPPDEPTSVVIDASVPPELDGAGRGANGVTWAFGPIEYRDGRVEPGLIVAAPVTIQGFGEYELLYLFPLTDVTKAIGLVRSAAIVTGVVLVLALGALAWWYSRRLVRPVRMASRAASTLAEGDLSSRLEVTGEDDMARLAASFNIMADSLVDQIGRLEGLSAMQQRFVADVSHELRTPLTTIRMAADLLSDQLSDVGSSPATLRAAELLVSEVDRFERLLGDLLEVSVFDAGAAVLELEEVDLVTLVTEVAESAQRLAPDVRISVAVRGGGPCLAVCDPRRVTRIVRNLVVNAIEYGGGLPVVIDVVEDDGGARVVVSDQGSGIRPEDLPHVFDRFWRADPSRARTLGGTGLGLAISREDARLHGGDLTVSSEPGAGTRFTLRLPIAPDDAAEL